MWAPICERAQHRFKTLTVMLRIAEKVSVNHNVARRQCGGGASASVAPSPPCRPRRGCWGVRRGARQPARRRSNWSAAGLDLQAARPRNRPPSPLGARTNFGRNITSMGNRDVTN